MTWQLLAAGEPRLAAAVPFYGPAPDPADFSGSPNAAVLGIYGGLDDRVKGSRASAEAALTSAGLEHELKSFNLMFSMPDIVKIMGPNTASYIQMADQLGTLEPGKLADIILLDGNPLDGYWNMLRTKVVLKGGRVVVDKR